jgi:L-alanine-DL-glutamate epimerase-like enolase superfamily enzyme
MQYMTLPEGFREFPGEGLPSTPAEKDLPKEPAEGARQMRRLSVRVEKFPIAGSFRIARGAKTEAVVVAAELEDSGRRGRGECVPYARYGESVESVVRQIEAVRPALEQGADRFALQELLPAGAARNALDCALWDLEAKLAGRRAFELAGVTVPVPVITAFTISVGPPSEMAAAAAAVRNRPLLKVKLAGEGDRERIAAVRAAAPDATLIVDANEAWGIADLERNLEACAAAGVELVEQPLPAGSDAVLAQVEHIVRVCADESLHDRRGLDELGGRYDAINVKLDKTGGLTEALALVFEAETKGFEIFVGCMVATSLAMAPALLLASRARWVDLDGPLLLARDRPDGLLAEGSLLHPPSALLWG